MTQSLRPTRSVGEFRAEQPSEVLARTGQVGATVGSADARRPTIVLKFGGTSLGNPARVRRAARRVRAHLRLDTQVVAVASAPGATTERILSWAARLDLPARAADREIDRALATGECLAAALLAASLRAFGVEAVSLNGGEAGIEATGEFRAGSIARVNAEPLQRLLRAGTVPVVAGFQGRRADGETVTLGRGASDTTAIALAAALGSVPCHLVTDVAAVYDRDPRLDPAARHCRVLSHAELVRLAEDGARVVHAGAARLALERQVPLFIYHYRSRFGEHGTSVRPGPEPSPGLG